MKLSMWMIANRLSALDPEVHIRDSAPIILRSARRAYATNCVHVFQVGKDAICNGEGDYVRLKDMSASQAFEIIQCVFDFYDDWNSDIMEAVSRMDYQQAIDESWHIFHNPVLLLDANCKALAMSAQYGEDEVDEEWKHLSEYGYLSAGSFRYLQSAGIEKESSQRSAVRVIRGGGGGVSVGWMSGRLSENGTLLGRLNVLELERKCNTGDAQLLQYLTSLLTPSLSWKNEKDGQFSSKNVFWEMIRKNWVSKEAIDRQLNYMSWEREDYFRVFLLQSGECGGLGEAVSLPLMVNLIAAYIPKASLMKTEDKIVVIVNENQFGENQVKVLLADILKQKNLRTGVSLAVRGIGNLYAVYRQAEAALLCGAAEYPEENYFRFYDCAMDFIVENSEPEELICACQPDVRRLWEEEEGGEQIQILKSYLANERSLAKTAAALFVHRNTLVYRVKKILETLEYSLEEDYTRDYMKLSVRILELYQKKEKQGCQSQCKLSSCSRPYEQQPHGHPYFESRRFSK